MHKKVIFLHATIAKPIASPIALLKERERERKEKREREMELNRELKHKKASTCVYFFYICCDAYF